MCRSINITIVSGGKIGATQQNTTQQNTFFNTIFDVFLCVTSVSFSFELFVPTLKSAFFSHYQRNYFDPPYVRDMSNFVGW